MRSRDPVEGGNDNTFTYPSDPINVFDLTGLSGGGCNSKACRSHLKKWKKQRAADIKSGELKKYGKGQRARYGGGWKAAKKCIVPTVSIGSYIFGGFAYKAVKGASRWAIRGNSAWGVFNVYSDFMKAGKHC